MDTPTLLVVDDEENIVTSLQRSLRDQFSIFTANSGFDAIKILENHKIDLILTDERMPGMSGIELLEQAYRIQPSTIGIIITAYTDVEVLTTALNLGNVRGFIPKPWKIEKLRNQLLEAVLKQNEHFIQQILDTTPDGITIFDILEKRVTYANRGTEDMLGYSFGEISTMPGGILTYLAHPDSGDLVQQHLALLSNATNDNLFVIQVGFLNGNGEWRLMTSWDRVLRRNSDGKPRLILSTMRDITKSWETHKALQESEANLEKAQSIGHMGSWIWDNKKNLLTLSNEMFQIFDLKINEFSGVPEDIIAKCVLPDDREMIIQAVQSFINAPVKSSIEFRILSSDQNVREVRVESGEIKLDNKGNLNIVRGIVQDISESKSIEKNLRKSLAEKDVLLREVHHRVKNNLAAILSLIQLEQANINDSATENQLFELGNRIKSMAIIHEKLYRSESVSKICFGDYLRSFISHLRTSSNLRSNIFTIIDADCVELSLDQAVPCGLIVNELVTNAIKYAFPHGKPCDTSNKCVIRIKMSVKNSIYQLVVADNGVGFPTGLDLCKAKSLGLRLVVMLGEHQLGGKISLQKNKGTKMILKFHQNPRSMI